jgi:DinB superfamily
MRARIVLPDTPRRACEQGGTATGSELRVRPEREVWSAIEYAAHSRDIIALHAYGVEQALAFDEPMFPPIADDLAESAAATYGDADPDNVSTELTTQASLLAEVADEAGGDAWSRGLTIGDTRSDVRRLLEHALHDSLHHLGDVERGLSRLHEWNARVHRTADPRSTSAHRTHAPNVTR